MQGKTNLNYDAAMLFPNGDNPGAFAIFDDKENNIGDAKKIACKPDANGRYGDADRRDMVRYNNSMEDVLYPRLTFLRNYQKYERAEIYTYPMSDDEKNIQLVKSWGEYGSLNFAHKSLFNRDTPFSFKFFYHQNQLMEEIYNYMKRQISFAGKEENAENSLEPVQGMSSRRRKAMENSAEASSINFSPTEEISRLKGLLDCGAITQEEYDDAKKKLLEKL